MNPLGTNTAHELHFWGEGPGLLEEKIDMPFCRGAGEKRRTARFKFQPVLYRRDFNRQVRAKTGAAIVLVYASGGPNLDDGDLLVGLDRLRRGLTRAEKQRRYCNKHCRV